MTRSRLAWQLLLGVAGLAVSAYLMATHYFAANVPLACSSGGIVDCEEVTTSAESMIGPLPVAVLGAIWFVALLVMVAAHRQWPYGPWMWIQVGWAIGGLLFVFYLVYAELFLIGSICSWCTVVHAIVVVLFLLTIYEATAPGEPLTSVG